MIKIPLTQDQVALIDDEDYELVSSISWHVIRPLYTYYAMNKIKGSMHRIIMKPDIGMQIDHIDWNGLNNQRSNLRICTASQHCARKPPTYGKLKGVYIERGRYRVRIIKDYKNIELGHFDNEEEAGRAYDEAAFKLFGEFAYLNFPGG